jgi:hypothetical protein
VSFHTIKNLGVGGLILILLLVAIYAYRHSEQTLRSLREHVDVYAPAEASLLKISKRIDTAKHGFTLYAARDRISDEDVLEPLTLLERGIKNVSEQLRPTNLRAEVASARAQNARMAFLGYVDEERDEPSGTTDSGMQFRARVKRDLVEVRKQLAALSSLKVSRSQMKDVGSALEYARSLLSVAERESQRYFKRERFDFDDVIRPVRQAIDLLRGLKIPDRYEDVRTAEAEGGRPVHEILDDLERALDGYLYLIQAYHQQETDYGPGSELNLLGHQSLQALGLADIALIDVRKILGHHLREA